MAVPVGDAGNLPRLRRAAIQRVDRQAQADLRREGGHDGQRRAEDVADLEGRPRQDAGQHLQRLGGPDLVRPPAAVGVPPDIAHRAGQGDAIQAVQREGVRGQARVERGQAVDVLRRVRAKDCRLDPLGGAQPVLDDRNAPQVILRAVRPGDADCQFPRLEGKRDQRRHGLVGAVAQQGRQVRLQRVGDRLALRVHAGQDVGPAAVGDPAGDGGAPGVFRRQEAPRPAAGRLILEQRPDQPLLRPSFADLHDQRRPRPGHIHARPAAQQPGLLPGVVKPRHGGIARQRQRVQAGRNILPQRERPAQGERQRAVRDRQLLGSRVPQPDRAAGVLNGQARRRERPAPAVAGGGRGHRLRAVDGHRLQPQIRAQPQAGSLAGHGRGLHGDL